MIAVEWRIFFVLVGPFAGTYVATLASAWPRTPRPMVGASRCARCGAEIAAWRQLPLVTWLIQGGRRRCCDGAIPRTYPLGEAAGLGVGLLAAAQGHVWAGMIQFAAGLTLAYIGLVDLRRFSIPLAGLAILVLEIGLDMARRAQASEALERVATGAVLALVFELLRRLIRREGRPGLGEGDVMLAACLGALVGWRLAPAVVAAAALAALVALALSGRRGPVPFGFWLCASAAPAAAWVLRFG